MMTRRVVWLMAAACFVVAAFTIMQLSAGRGVRHPVEAGDVRTVHEVAAIQEIGAATQAAVAEVPGEQPETQVVAAGTAETDHAPLPLQDSPAESIQLVAIGDSLTQGVGDRTDNGGYVGVVADGWRQEGKAGIGTVNLGKRGLRSDQLLKRLDTEETADELRKAEMITLTIGGNDLMRVVQSNILDLRLEPFQEQAAAFGERLQHVLSRLRELNPESPIYVLGLFNPFQAYFADMPEMGQILLDWNETIRQASGGYQGVTFIPIDDLFLGASDEDLIGDDWFHPSEAGYKLIGERLLHYMLPGSGEAVHG